MAKKNRLVEERAAHALPIEQLKIVLHGGQEKANYYKQALGILSKHPDLLEADDDFSIYGLSRQELRKKTFDKIVKFRNLTKEIKDPKLVDAITEILNASDPDFAIRRGVHLWLFGAAINGQGTQEMIVEYLPKLYSLEYYGCFCMTELGTGSYLQSLETTATYAPEKDEFIIHSPTITSTKWWIGGAAQTATHGVVFAKLILDGQDIGTHHFVVRLRDENFNLCPGISIGDVGPKRGLNGVDNGWVRFDHVHIPRTNMLMKWSQVTREGKYVKADFPQLAYGAVIDTRIAIAKVCAFFVKRAVTIASRYCIVRDQHSIEGQCLMDYTVQQERILGAIASAYALDFASDIVFAQMAVVDAELQRKETKHLKDLHNQAAAMKGFGALWAGKAINDCILAMGGHGYSDLSGLPKLLNDFAPNIPYEGDAIVMVQQMASYLLKSVSALFQGKQLEGESIQYLQKLPNLSEMKCAADPTKPLSLKEMEEAGQWLALTQIKNSALKMQTEIGETGDQMAAWNKCQLSSIQAAKAHFNYFLISVFKDKLNTLPKEVTAVLTQVAELFALLHLQENLSAFYEESYFPLTRGNLIREQILSLYRSLRPYITALVDAWDIPDSFLKTPLGRYDGEIYENYFKAVNSLKQDIKPTYWKEKN